MAGAVVGELIAGTTGAIIGSSQKVEPIRSTNYRVDHRKVILQILYNGEVKFLFFRSHSYDIFLRLMSEKVLKSCLS